LDTVNFDSAVPGLSRTAAYSLRVRFPSGEEQERVAAYLDASCATIDRVIDAKRKQIETLDESRRSHIQHVVTAGTAASRDMQQVNRDWIREVPLSWEVVQIKRVVARMDYGISESTQEEGRFRVLKMGHLSDGEITLTEQDFVDEVDPSLLLEQGDLLYNRTNSPDQVAKAALFRGSREDRITFASYLVRLRLNHRADPLFMNFVLNSAGFLGFARRLAIPSVQQSNLNSTRYGRLVVPLPKIGEQRKIAAHLVEHTSEFRELVGGIEKQIETLMAYRKSLIHECLTGKRRISDEDVRRVSSV
jgi:type I restriction enzyme, S subunit